jgi:type II secretory pathway pseudopilin PulG
MTTAAGRVRRRTSASGDAGFSLVETVVAMTVAALIFGALGGVLLVSLKASLVGRQAQQAIDLATKTMERDRSVDYAQLGLSTTDVAGDGAITASGYAVRLANGTTTTEPIAYVTNPALNPHRSTVSLDGTTFTVARYVTMPPADSTTGATYRRLTVVVSWVADGVTRVRSTSTLVSAIGRGLPAPQFNTRVTGSVTVNRGSTLTIAVAVANRGTRNHWNISTAGTPWQFTWYNDNSASGACNGVRDNGENEPMGSSPAGTGDTGTINSDSMGCLVGQYAVPPTQEAVSYTLMVTASVTAPTDNELTQTASQVRAAKVEVK